LLLDGIQDPRNLGAILRSAHCTNVDGVILVKKNAAPLTATALKASAGLAEYLDIMIANSVEEAVILLKKSGYNLYLATFDGQNALACNYAMPLCVVIGSEGLGISRSIMHEGTKITLPQKSSDISYNASVAASLLTFLISTRFQKI
jgi:23S rRNA (guanosine2251-2'-O)-methyltransferase